MPTEILAKLILIAPFVIVAFFCHRRYGAKLRLVRLRPFLTRLLTWHISLSLIAYATYALVLATSFENGEPAARGCGQGLLQFDTDLLGSCSDYAQAYFGIWFAGSSVFFGFLGLAVIMARRAKKPEIR